MVPRRGPRRAEERLSRLLVMLPWLMDRGEVPLADVARHFKLTEAEVVADLELASMCGLPPFVDELIDLFIDEGMVYVGVPRLFTRPLRLTAPEGFALLAAGRAAMELPGAEPEGPLGRALAKLGAVLGDEGVVVDIAASADASGIAAAAAAGDALRITYRGASRDTTSERDIVPRAVFSEQGNWYVVADDDRSGERRTFRIDRIEHWEPTGRQVAIEAVEPPAPGTWFTDADVPRATVRLTAEAAWAAERYPVDEVEVGADGMRTVRMPVASEAWFQRLLLRLGGAATVLEPIEYRDLATRAAAEVLAVYDS